MDSTLITKTFRFIAKELAIMHFGCISKINITCFSKFVKNTTKQLKNSKGSASSMPQFILQICKMKVMQTMLYQF
jgi:hypothetical protein